MRTRQPAASRAHFGEAAAADATEARPAPRAARAEVLDLQNRGDVTERAVLVKQRRAHTAMRAHRLAQTIDEPILEDVHLAGLARMERVRQRKRQEHELSLQRRSAGEPSSSAGTSASRGSQAIAGQDRERE
eukprot:scaffold16814_cov69-Phaeocystis_antarctica.AAC.9